MEFNNLKIDFTEEQSMVNASAKEFCADKSDTKKARELIDSELGFDTDTWDEITQLGWTGINIDDQYGGMNFGISAAIPIVEHMGNTMMSIPYPSHLLASELIGRLGDQSQKSQWLPPLCDGKRGTVAFLDNEDWGSEPQLKLIKKNDHYLMTGEKLLVSDALSADIIIVLATIDTHPVFVIVESHMLKPQDLHPRTLIDETKRAADISLQNIIIEETQIMHASHEIVRDIKLLGSLLMAAESVGVISITLKTIVDYLTTRKQFGKLIGSYQSLKHPTVEILLEMDSAKSLVYHAASIIESGTLSIDSQIACHMSKAKASDALSFAGDRAVQFHGGMGFTYDCDAMLFIRRAQWANQQFGDPQYHRNQLAKLIFD